MLLTTTSNDLTQVVNTPLTTLEALTNAIVSEELKIYTPPRNNVVEIHFDCLRKDEIVFLRLTGDVLHITGIGQHAEIAEFVVCKFIEEKLSEYEWIQAHDVVALDNIPTWFVDCHSVALDKICQKEVRP